jgi:hypothetical protein
LDDAAAAWRLSRLTLRPAVLHRDIAALDIVGFFETLPDRVGLRSRPIVVAAGKEILLLDRSF